ncbi:LmbE-like protein [Candidatus Koribacter versatilis Ellin345]|uniref:LmbE-like protein n=1 Tax=Koribacter versatilis (strain Ellin345) TaxID=204669 RepID=Q1IPW3_KORVE|nr:PIG-L family deacetylase [Candidatus Koribacter versatilis]ABF41087.1 LmbE-like protein [Candidatus Koribacter versatilis Ellin345]
MDPLAPLLNRTLVLVAHPDDESISCGALLQRVREPIVVYATDGGPQDEYFWGRYGSREKYVAIRRAEAHDACAAVGVSEVLWLADDAGCQFQDQRLFRNLPAAADALRKLVRQHTPDVILTLAYEGGHPDHDSCNFLGRQIADECSLLAWEAPLYFRKGGDDILLQEFHSTNGTEIEFVPTAEELRRKRTMCEAYVSQQGTVAIFENNLRETFRPMARYDYSRPPHDGVLNYEAWQWPIKGQQVADKFMEYLQGAPRAESAR